MIRPYPPYEIPLLPWVREVGKMLPQGVRIYDADHLSVVLGTSNGSLDGLPLRRYYLTVGREAYERDCSVIRYACSEILNATLAGYVMVPTP